MSQLQEQVPGEVGYPADDQWQEATIAKVRECSDGWELTFTDGWSLWVQRYSGSPKVGDTIRTYGKGVGFSIRGVFINGVLVNYETEKQYDARMAAERRQRELDDQSKYEQSKAALTVRINALPGPLQKRLFQFRERSPDFGWKFEGYELACAEASAQIATACERRPRGEGEVDDWFTHFANLSWAQQVAIAPAMDGLSGNMQQFCIRQSRLLMLNPELVPKDHGALCLLVGCEIFQVCDAHQNNATLRRKRAVRT